MNTKKTQLVQTVKDRIAQAQKQDTPQARWNTERASIIAQANKALTDQYNRELALLTSKKDEVIAGVNQRYSEDVANLKAQYDAKKVSEADLKAQFEAKASANDFYEGLMEVIDIYVNGYEE